PMFDLWMRLLGATPDSVLWLLGEDAESIGRLRNEAVARGVDGARLIFAARAARLEYLARQRHADLFLDTFPVNAHTTASDALWMGVPVLTLAGRSFASRVAASLVTALGAPELVATTPADYESVARRLSSSPTALAGVRSKLEVGRRDSGVFDAR